MGMEHGEGLILLVEDTEGVVALLRRGKVVELDGEAVGEGDSPDTVGFEGADHGETFVHDRLRKINAFGECEVVDKERGISLQAAVGVEVADDEAGGGEDIRFEVKLAELGDEGVVERGSGVGHRHFGEVIGGCMATCGVPLSLSRRDGGFGVAEGLGVDGLEGRIGLHLALHLLVEFGRGHLEHLHETKLLLSEALGEALLDGYVLPALFHSAKLRNFPKMAKLFLHGEGTEGQREGRFSGEAGKI